MKSQDILQYLFPFLFLLFYFWVNRKKEKEREPIDESPLYQKEANRVLPPAPIEMHAALPPVNRELPTLSSQIEKRRLKSSLEELPQITTLSDAPAESIIPAPSHLVHTAPCRAHRALRSLPSLKDAFIISEVFRRWDE